jgi:hypothetical protein
MQEVNIYCSIQFRSCTFFFVYFDVVCTGTMAYAVSVGVVSTFATAVLLLIQFFMSDKPKIIDIVASVFLFVWWAGKSYFFNPLIIRKIKITISSLQLELASVLLKDLTLTLNMRMAIFPLGSLLLLVCITFFSAAAPPSGKLALNTIASLQLSVSSLLVRCFT